MLSPLAEEVARSRYYCSEKETWEELAIRNGIAMAVHEENSKYWTDEFSRIISDMLFIPGGRTLRNSGRMKQGLLNCAVLPIGDSIEEIGETLKNALILWSYGAGIGIDFTPLRHEGASLKTKGGFSSGMCSFLHMFDTVAKPIETGGQRRSGCLGMCSVSHPEIEQFIQAKYKDKELSFFNLSVSINNSFLDAVEDDSSWDLMSAGHIANTVSARGLWETIIKSMVDNAEPGLINYDRLRTNNSHYFQIPIATNLCGEIPLSAYSMCCLGSLVLPSFISGRSTDWKKLEATIPIAVRFLDNVLDVNNYALRESEIATKNSRKIGMGVMGLHDYLILKKVRYGSDKGMEEVEKLFRFIRDNAYKASVELAKEKGAFPKYERRAYCESSYIKKLPPRLRKYIKQFGVRNNTLLAAPPTGTTSLIPECSSGIEPVFSLGCLRSDRISDRVYIHPEMKKILESGEKSPNWLIDSRDLTPADHLDMQLTVQKYIDNSCSKTINCPKGTKVEDVSELLLEYIRDLTGVTIYVDGSKGEQPLTHLNEKEMRKYLKEATTTPQEEKCRGGSCDL